MKREFDEAELARRLKQNSEHALRLCIDHYYSYIVVIVENITGQALCTEDKEEIVSETFISLWKHRGRLEPEKYGSLKYYLAEIARNLSRNYLRKATRKQTVNIEEVSDIPAREDTASGSIRREMIQCLKEGIDELSHDEQLCILSFYFYDKSLQQIAKETGFKENTIKSKLFRGRNKLREKMKERGFGYEECKVFFG